VECVELDAHINDPAFAEAAAGKLLSLMGRYGDVSASKPGATARVG
jgi:hypothetical protein